MRFLTLHKRALQLLCQSYQQNRLQHQKPPPLHPEPPRLPPPLLLPPTPVCRDLDCSSLSTT